MLVRLEHALECPDLARQMLLVPSAKRTGHSLSHLTAEVHLVVGYHGSARSQTALDLTLWIAHQTRLATGRAVKVHVVYVADRDRAFDQPHAPEAILSTSDVCHAMNQLAGTGDVTQPDTWSLEPRDRWQSVESMMCSAVSYRASATAIATDRDHATPSPTAIDTADWQLHQFEKADRILWQARNLADEWRGSLETHLRFGRLGDELQTVARQLGATAVVIGCSSPTDAVVRSLDQDLPCPILGIPTQLPCR